MLHNVKEMKQRYPGLKKKDLVPAEDREFSM